MSALSEDSGRNEQLRITKRELIKYVAGARLPRNVREEINRQVKIIGSPIQQWVAAADAEMQDPLAVDWGAISAMPDEGQSNEATTREQTEQNE